MKLNCDACSLRGNCVSGRGPSRARLVIVNDYPTYEDLKLHTALGGVLGKLQEAVVQAVLGLNPAEVFYTFAVRGDTRGESPDPKQLAACRVWLLQELQRINPRWVIAGGNAAKNLLVGPTPDFADARGHLFPDPFHDWKVFVTYSIREMHKFSAFAEDGKTRLFWTGSVPWFYRRDLLAFRTLLQEDPQ